MYNEYLRCFCLNTDVMCVLDQYLKCIIQIKFSFYSDGKLTTGVPAVRLVVEDSEKGKSVV